MKVDQKAENATTWFGLLTAMAGLLSKAQKFEAASTNAVCVLMFSYLLVYVLHDLYDAWWYEYKGDEWYESYKWSYFLSGLALICLGFWFAGYWLQRTLGPFHPGPVMDENSAYWLILPAAVALFLYSLYDLADAYHYEYDGYEYTIRAAIVSMVVVVVLGFLSYPG